MRKVLAFFVVVAMLLVMGQGQLGRVGAQGGTAEPTQAPTDEAIQINETLSLVTIRMEETGKNPDFEITIIRPKLEGAAGPTVDTFNKAVDEIIVKVSEEFKKNVLDFFDPNATPVFELPMSSLQVFFVALTARNNLLSIQFNVGFYMSGAAHPSSYSVSLNYDLAQNKVLALADLFQPNSSYLEKLATYAKESLQKNDMLLFPEGADPKPENYRNWNIADDGLVITFDVYQVAPYAAGPQEVVVPFSQLADIMNPTGPLSGFVE